MVIAVSLVASLTALQFGALSQITAFGTTSSSASSSSSAQAPTTATPSATSTTTQTANPSTGAGAYAAQAPTTKLPLSDLSQDLASYVDKQNGAMGVAVYDVTHHQEYGDDDDETFTLASSAKVYILCGYLDMLEGQGRAATSAERYEIARMIEYSDNNAAQWLFNHLGGAKGQQAYLARIGIDDYAPDGGLWGWARLSPDDMAHILSLLQSGGILTPKDRSYALSLLGDVEVGRWGVGNTAPKGARVYMKDGWVPGPDGKWAQNSSGIVVDGNETYIISVYTAHNPRYDWSKVQHICAEVAGLLTD
jgi:beta-lactamase class A